MSEDTNKKGERNRYKDTRMKNGLQGFWTVRPIYFGLAFFLVGVIGYLGVSVYYDLMSLQTALIYVFIAIAVASFPVTVVVEIIKWRKEKTEQKKQTR